MAIVWARETARDRSLDVEKENGGSSTRSWLVRVDDPTTALSEIQTAPGVSIGDPHPDQGDFACERLSVKSADDSGLLYTITADYSPTTAGSGSGGEGNQSEVEGLQKVWSGSSSVGSQPLFLDRDMNVMTNSAGDPLEGLEADLAQFHLTLTTYYATHENNQNGGWVQLARRLTNTCNSLSWNGGAPYTWKCQGCSARVQSDRQGPDGSVRWYWEATWDFAYRDDGWQLQPWDIGFNELVDDTGTPQQVFGISAGDTTGASGGSEGDDGPCEQGLNRRAIKGQDGKPVRQPVALQNGIAKEPCLRPDRLSFYVYREEDFNPVFGEVFTPPG